VEAIEEGPEHAPAQLLTSQQRAVIFAYGRLGSIAAAAADIGIAEPTAKQHLTAVYRRLGVDSAPQAIYVLMGGEAAVQAVPEASNDARVLRRRVAVLERQLADCENALASANALERARHAATARPSDPMYIPLMTDGQIGLKNLREWSTRFDADAASTSEMRMSAREWVDLLSYYTRRPGSGMVEATPG
jgi:DNA-binding CsgD family transcriptional regulator